MTSQENLVISRLGHNFLLSFEQEDFLSRTSFKVHFKFRIHLTENGLAPSNTQVQLAHLRGKRCNCELPSKSYVFGVQESCKVLLIKSLVEPRDLDFKAISSNKIVYKLILVSY